MCYQMQEQFDFVNDVNNTVDRAHQSIKKIRKINEDLDAFVKQYGKDENKLHISENACCIGRYQSDDGQTGNQIGEIIPDLFPEGE